MGILNRTQQTVVWFLIVGVIFHFLMTAIYVTPRKYFPKWVNNLSIGYMWPAFHQGWSLFAPEPPVQEKMLEFRIKTNGEWQPWISPGMKNLGDHEKMRPSRANISFRIEQNIAYWIWNEKEIAQGVKDHKGGDFDVEKYLRPTRSYRAAVHYTTQWLKTNYPDQTADSLDLRVKVGTPPAFPNYKGQWTEDYLNLPRHAME